MALSPGTRFGPYEIAEGIGAGGMGVVYRATDTKLKREVAIKVLPASLASDAERLARFQREAEVLASLNHPNIAQIYGLEESDGTTALILELVEGQTLDDRIAEGALPIDEALGIARQIAEALEAAHSQGIVHRDLKPANIKLRTDGTVKVLDFGIAKALDVRAASGLSPVMATPAVTETGIILGTAGYMSPEQARGKGVDQRTDIWAFGCLLYEMLTGQPAFGGEEVTVTLARILERDPDMDSLPASVPPAVSHTIKLCLQKDVRTRVADIRDAKLSIEGGFEPEMRRPAGDKLLVWRESFPVVIVASLLVSAVAGLIGWSLWPSPETRWVTRFEYDLPEGQALRSPDMRALAISPDGRHFAYNTRDGIYLRTMGELEALLIPGTDVPFVPSMAFSPDGQSLAYVDNAAGEILKRIAINGSAAVTIGEPEGFLGQGMSWQPDGTILYSGADGIYRVSANGGGHELIIPLENVDYYGAELLPNGDSVLFSISGNSDWEAAQVVIQSLSTGERTVLFEGGSDVRYLPTGHLIYALGDGLFARAFDLDTLTVSGGAVPLVQGMMRTSGTTGAANYSVSDNGTLVYVTGTAPAESRRLVWVDREGRETPIDTPPRNYQYPRLSPDGTKVALDELDDEFDIWIWDLSRETLTRLTFDPGRDRFPVWSPDGERIAYLSQRREGSDQVNTDWIALDWRAVDGASPPERLLPESRIGRPATFLPNGAGILLTDNDIGVFPMEGEATLLLGTPFQERSPELSPDGRWLAYESNESGRAEIYVRPFPNVGSGRWQVSRGGGVQPLWARDGEELFYRDGDAMMAVPIESDQTFVQGNPEVLFESEYAPTLGARNYDVSLDGEQFLMLKEVEDASEPTRIMVVLNWFEELRAIGTTH